MSHLTDAQLLGLLALVLASAKVFGSLCTRIGQPAVLGELIAGVVLGVSGLGLVDPNNEIFKILREVGVVILLFEIGLETDLKQILKVGGASTTVAIAGVAFPFALGYLVGYLLGLDNTVSIVLGATLTATSVGITARVLADLGKLNLPESRIILGAAVIDDIIGLIILAIVGSFTSGKTITPLHVLQVTGLAFGFLVVTLLVGSFLVPPLVRWLKRFELFGSLTTLAIILTFGMAWLADISGSAMIIGAFAAGLLLGKTEDAHAISKGVAHIGHFFVPIFFVVIGAGVDCRVFNPFNPDNHSTLLIGGSLIVVAVLGKFAAGYAPFWFKGNKAAIGVGMIPRGEVGLIFAQMGITAGVFDTGRFSAVTLMVMVTTFLAPPLLKFLLPSDNNGTQPPEPDGLEELVTKP